MTNPEYTAIMLLIDRSGSMNTIQRSAEDGINEFIRGQATPPKGRRVDIRIAEFDTEYDTVQKLKRATASATYTLVPRGGTSLLDAMGRAITEFGAELAAMPEDKRPGVVILAVMTDGEENSSQEYNWETVKSMVERQERDYAWQILYLGANQDAIAVAGNLGIQRKRSMTYAASAAGTRSSYNSVSNYVNTASGLKPGAQPAGFSDKDREDAQQS